MSQHHRHHTFLVLLLCVLTLSGATLVQAKNPTLSSWINNLSYNSALEPNSVPWLDWKAELQVVGGTAHTLWFSRNTRDWNNRRWVYRRLRNDGQNTDAPQIISIQPGGPGGELPFPQEESRYLCAAGNAVHIITVRNLPTGWHHELFYHRSTNAGATFAPARLLVRGANAWHIDQLQIACDGQQVVIGYRYRPNWYTAFQAKMLISSDAGATFRPVTAVSSNSFENIAELALSGTNLYVLHAPNIEYGGIGWGARLELATSVNGGQSFRNTVISTAARDGRSWVLPTKDLYNAPNLAVAGNNVYVIWLQLDTDSRGTRTLMYRRSVDRGQTFGAPLVLLRDASLPHGPETIVAKGAYVYALYQTNDNRFVLRRSNDAGASFLGPTVLATTGWWPELQLDPADASGARVSLFLNAPTYRRSVDGGATWDNPLVAYPAFSVNRYERPHHVISSTGRIHSLASAYFYSGSLCNGFCDADIMYRVLAPAPTPATTGAGLRLYSPRPEVEDRADNMQVLSKTLNRTAAFTAEVWVRDDGDGRMAPMDYFMPVFYKQKAVGTDYSAAYSLGTIASAGGRQIAAYIETSTGRVRLTAPANTGLLGRGVWTHLAITFAPGVTPNNFRLYRNGQLLAATTVSGTMVPHTGNLFVGAYGKWLVDDLRIWAGARTQAQIAASMKQPLGGGETNLMAYFNLNNTTRDITGHGNDGILMYREAFVPGKF